MTRNVIFDEGTTTAMLHDVVRVVDLCDEGDGDAVHQSTTLSLTLRRYFFDQLVLLVVVLGVSCSSAVEKALRESKIMSNSKSESDSNISDEKLIQLWRDPNFSGSYRGIKTFQLLLKTDLDIDVSEKRLYKVLKKDQIFLIHQKRHTSIKRRPYDVNFYGQLVQIDLAHMFEDPITEEKYFLLLIDVFSFKIFVKSLKDKSSNTVAKALADLFEEFGADIYEIQSDRGSEFLGAPSKNLFKEKKILYRSKFGKNKANFAEEGILLVKKKLYMTL